MKREVSNPSSPCSNNSPPTFPTLSRTPIATTTSKLNSIQCTGTVAQDIIASDCAASCSKSRTGRGKKVTFLPVTLTTRVEEVQNNQNNSPEFVHDKEPGGDTQAGGSGSSSGCGGSSFQTKAGTGSVYSHYLREQLGTPYPYSNSATCFTESGVSSSSSKSGKVVFPVVNVHSPSGGRTGRCARICGSVSPAGIASSSGSGSGLLTAKFPLTTASVSHRSGYELEISRSIDVSSSSASIFYTVPVVSGRKAAGRREAEDFLGTPSILKPFRDLQEPTRFLTTKNTVGASVSPSNPKTAWKASHRLKQKAVTTGKASISFSASTDQILSNEDEEKAATLKRRRHLSKSYSDFSLHKQPGRLGAKEDQKMPIRVRMRRDEYFYTETSSKSTQTSDPDMDLEEGEMSRKSETERIRASETQSVDRSTSPIQDISCSSPLKKLEDLEKVTGHFVIQRFFTRTEQDFTTWLEQQLAVASTSCSKGVQVENVEEEEVTVEDVAATEGAQAETEVEALLQRRPSTPQISITEPPEDVMVQEGEEWKENSAENDGNMLAVDGAAVVAILRPLSTSKENIIAGGEDTKGEAETENVLNSESQVESNDKESETVEGEDGEKTNGALVQVEADQELESSNVGSSSIPQEDSPNACKTTDLIPCECFSEYFLHEENIARLLISLSPKASSTITEAHFLTATVSSQDGMSEFGEEKIAKFEALLLSTKSRVLGSIRKSKSSHSMSHKRKSKSVESFPCEDSRQDQESRTASTDHGECEIYPDFVFPRPRGNRRIRKSTSVDSCLGTEYSSIKTRNDSGTSTLGRYVVDGSYEKFSETFDYLHDSQSQGDDQVKMAEENTGFVTEDSGIKSNPPNSMRSETSLSSPKKGDGEQVTEPIVVAKVICSRKSANEATGRTKPELRRFKSKSSERRDLVSGESDTESEFIRSENYHARSEAESDTDMTTDGDAIVEDPIAYRRRTEFSEDDQRFDLDMTDVDDDDKDNDLTARLELDDFQLELDKPLHGIRNSCTQTNRSLYSPAWSQGSATSQTTNGSGSHFDLEVVAKKFPVETTSAGGRKHNYLPSSSSSLNFVNVSMNLNVNSKTEESKFKLSVSLPGGVGRSRLPPAVGGAKTSGGFRVHNYPRQSISEQDSRDLPSLWAHVRNRLDSKVSAADGASGNDTVDGRRDSLVLSGKCSRPLDPMSPREKAMGHTPTQDYKMTQTKKPHQYHLRHNQIMQNKAYKNSDRIKRSLARLSKLLDNDK